jgi:hypothetical protein
MKFFKKTDIIVIVVILAIGITARVVYGRMFSGKAVKAEIYYYSELVETVDLARAGEKTFSIPQDENVSLYLDGKGNIQFVASDCPDKVCVNTGKIGLAGQYAACLPNGIIVKIVSAGISDDGGYDIILQP